MIGKTFIDNNWCLCKYANNTLYLLKCTCTKPMFITQESIKHIENILCVFFENGEIYYFDLHSCIENKVDSDFCYVLYENPSYFVDNILNGNYNFPFEKIKKVSFINGIISPMLQSSTFSTKTLSFKELELKISFNNNESLIEDTCKLYQGTMLLNSKSSINTYSIDVEFEPINSLSLFGEIIKKIYNFIKIINIDFNPAIEKIIVETEHTKMYYCSNNINIGGSYVYRYNFLSNAKNGLDKILAFSFSDNANYDFLNLLDKSKFDLNDYYNLAKSIETITPNYDTNNNDEIGNEIKKYSALKSEIKKTIEIFESNNGNIDTNKKSFILSLVEIPRFRQKIEFILSRYNIFAEQYKSYVILSNKQILSISKDIQTARNQIHGKELNLNKNKLVYEVQYVLMGLCLYIFDTCGLEKSDEFNFLNHIFSSRIQQININI